MPEAEQPATPERPSPHAGESFRLLFVCTGNTCRSPLSEAIARRDLAGRGWDRVEVRSAGIAAFAGGGASEGAARVAARHGLDLAGHRARPIDPDLVDWADLILTMSPGHLDGIVALGGGERVAVITSFAAGREGAEGPGARARSVRDPFGGGDPDYEATYEELVDLVERVLDRLAPVVSP